MPDCLCYYRIERQDDLYHFIPKIIFMVILLHLKPNKIIQIIQERYAERKIAQFLYYLQKRMCDERLLKDLTGS